MDGERESCCREKTLRDEVFSYAAGRYHSTPEYLWEDTPNSAVLRHSGNRKWYALIMDLPRERLGLSGEGIVDILNVKCDPDKVLMLQSTDGFLPAYHMSKTKWISVLLDGTVTKATVLDLLDESHRLTAAKKQGMKSGKKQVVKSAGTE